MLHRAKKFVAHIRSSRKAAEAFRETQRDAIRKRRESRNAGGVGAPDLPIEQEAEEEDEEEDPGVTEFATSGGLDVELDRVLELRTPVETRWNSTFYMIERYASSCVYSYWLFFCLFLLRLLLAFFF